ncbi:MAG: hypothetical protein ABF649_21975 [Bacillus sp. (in: firmicutes)]
MTKDKKDNIRLVNNSMLNSANSLGKPLTELSAAWNSANSLGKSLTELSAAWSTTSL